MGRLLQLLSKIELGIHIISFLIFIPVTVLVFLPQPHPFTQEQLQTYSSTYSQITQSFVTSAKESINCSMNEIYLNNDYCLYRCSDLKSCSIHDYLQSCPGEASYEYIFNEKMKYCSDRVVLNDILDGELTENDNLYPIFKISQEGQVTRFHYFPTDSIECRSLVQVIGNDLQNYSDFHIFTPFKESLLFLWFTNIPILVMGIVFLFIYRCTKYNFKQITMIVIIMLNIVSISLIVNGINLFTKGNILKQNLNYLGNSCMVEEEKTVLRQINFNFRINEGFTYFSGVLCLFLAIIIAVQGVLRLIEYKYDRLKKKEIDFYELQEMK